MNQIPNHNDNGGGTPVPIPAPRKKPAADPLPASAFKESHVTFQTADGTKSRGTLLRMTRLVASFEVYNPSVIPQLSEALDEFKIILHDRTAYAGRVVICNVMDAGTKVVCQATLSEAHWLDVDAAVLAKCDDQLLVEFDSFLGEWQKLYKVFPEYENAITKIEFFLTDLRLWLEKIESSLRSFPEVERLQLERKVITKLSPRILPLIDSLFENFEKIAARLDLDLRPIHRIYIQRRLHSIVLCAPFANRAYHKPLGYPGDYEMVNMMARDPQEGASMFAKVFNVWLHHQGSALAHRNRLADLVRRIESEALRLARNNGRARIYNFACGPAIEVQNFLDQSALGGKVEFTLTDFNAETLEYTANILARIKNRRGWRTPVQFQKINVNQLIKEDLVAAKKGVQPEYDFVYCAGLFDYLTDETCRKLIKIFYRRLAPGGLLYLTNVSPLTGNRGSLELILDWHLIYRDARQMKQLCSDLIPDEMVGVRTDETGINIFLEARKPHDP